MPSSEIARRRGELALAVLLAAVLDDLLGDLVVLGRVDLIAGLGHAVEAEDFDRRRRTDLLERVAAIVEHRAHLAERAAGDEHVAGAQRAFLDQDGRHRAAVAVEARLDHEAGGRLVRVRLELEHLGGERDRLEQLVDVLALERRDVDVDRLAAPLLGDQAVVGELLLDALGLRVGHVDLVDRDDDRDLRRPWRATSASTVCGMTPSFAATTSTTMSVACAPRARISVNASWPGVSRNTMSP